jgi:phosphatidate cytidylyltransferase
MLARIPVILIGIPAVYWLLVSSGDLVRSIFLVLICLGGQFELDKMLNRESGQKPLAEWVSALIILSACHTHGEKGLLFGFAASTIVLMLSIVLRGLRGDGCRRFCHGLFSLVYLPFCLGFFLIIGKNNCGHTLFAILCSIWALDIGAYVVGMSLRGPKLAPLISPNKTISGAIGGAASCILFFIAASNYQLLQISGPRIWILAISVAVIGQIADLFESVLKRESEIKDSGALLGAHGGILDRIDSILFLGPVCYALINF